MFTIKIENLRVTSIFDLYQHDLSVDNLDLKDEYKSSRNKRFYIYDKILERVWGIMLKMSTKPCALPIYLVE